MNIARLEILEGKAAASNNHWSEPKGVAQEVRGIIEEVSLDPNVFDLKVSGKAYKICAADLGNAKTFSIPRIDVGEEVILHLHPSETDTIVAIQIIKGNLSVFRVILVSNRHRDGSLHYYFEKEIVKEEEWVIEFRNGSFFQDLKNDNGGPKESAQKFDSEKAAETFMDTHQWIYINGGMAVRY